MKMSSKELNHTHTNAGEHWNYLVEYGDSKQIWQAIG